MDILLLLACSLLQTNYVLVYVHVYILIEQLPKLFTVITKVYISLAILTQTPARI